MEYWLSNSGLDSVTIFEEIETTKQMLGILENGYDETYFPLPEGAKSFNNHWYYVYNIEEIKDWNSAKEFCEEQNGYLATISSEEENQFLYNYMKNDMGYKSAYFGFTDENTEGTWEWVNGEKVVYTNWHPAEPNQENSKEDYAMFYYKYSDGLWNDGDFNGNTLNGGTVFICEWDNSSSDNSKVQDDSESTASKLFTEKIEEYENFYGTAQIHTNGDTYMTGLCLIKLVDFAKDGQPELVLVYPTGEDGIEWQYTFEVWEYRKKEISQVAVGDVCYTDGPDAYLNLVEKNDGTYLCPGGNYISYYGYDENSTFGVVRETKMRMDSTLGWIYEINGETFSYEEYSDKQSQWLGTCEFVDYPLYDCGGDSDLNFCIEENEESKKMLGM